MTFAYNDTHRLFLQASIAERIFSETTAEEMYRKSCEATSGISVWPRDLTIRTSRLNTLRN